MNTLFKVLNSKYRPILIRSWENALLILHHHQQHHRKKLGISENRKYFYDFIGFIAFWRCLSSFSRCSTMFINRFRRFQSQNRCFWWWKWWLHSVTVSAGTSDMQMLQAMPEILKSSEAELAKLPKPRTYDQLSQAERDRLVTLIGADPAKAN